MNMATFIGFNVGKSLIVFHWYWTIRKSRFLRNLHFWSVLDLQIFLDKICLKMTNLHAFFNPAVNWNEININYFWSLVSLDETCNVLKVAEFFPNISRKWPKMDFCKGKFEIFQFSNISIESKDLWQGFYHFIIHTWIEV